MESSTEGCATDRDFEDVDKVVTEGKMVDEEEQSRKDLWGTLTLNAR